MPIDVVIPKDTEVNLNGVNVVLNENVHFSLADLGDVWDAVAEQLSAANLLSLVDLTHEEVIDGKAYSVTYGAGGVRQVCEKPQTVKTKTEKPKKAK